MKKIICSLAVLGMIASSTPVFAAEVEKSSSGHSFNKSWEAYASDDDWVMEYGYNTSWINEDYTHTKHKKESHTAIVKNANGSHTDSDSAGSWAKIEVVHSGSSVTYKLSY